MEAFTFVFSFLRDKPEWFITTFVGLMWFLADRERREQQKSTASIQIQTIEALNEVKNAVNIGNELLRLLTQGRDR